MLRALINAHGIVVGPGGLYTSVLPNLLVEGSVATIYGVNAVRIYVANLMTEPGETDHYTLDDHLRVIRAHTGFELFDYILVNRRPIDDAAARRYVALGSELVVAERVLQYAGNAQLVDCDPAIEWRQEDSAPSAVARPSDSSVRSGGMDLRLESILGRGPVQLRLRKSALTATAQPVRVENKGNRRFLSGPSIALLPATP